MKKTFWVLLLAAQLSACSMAPDYVRPDVNVPSQWTQTAATETAAIAADWWTLFGDPVLNDLVAASLSENRDLKIAVSRIEQAQAQLGTTRAQQMPQVTGNMTEQRSLRSGETLPKIQGDRHAEDYKATLGVSYEIDLWGRLSDASNAAREKVLASEYNRQALRLSLESQVVSGYFHLRALDRQLEISRDNLTAQQETLRLTQRRFEGGLASGYDFAQAQAQTEQTRTTLPELQRQIALQENALSILLGRNPGPIARGLSIDELAHGVTPPAGLPSDLLTRRPDVLAAEAQLRAANASIGAARAAFFPKISLTGAIGYESNDLHVFGDPTSSLWSLAKGLTQPIFMGGALTSQLKAAEGSQHEMVATYQKTVQTAFREAEDGFVNLRLTGEQEAGKRQRANALAEAQRIANLRYQEGLTSFMDVLDAQRNQSQAELDVVTLQNQQLAASVSLFVALGGGWEAETK